MGRGRVNEGIHSDECPRASGVMMVVGVIRAFFHTQDKSIKEERKAPGNRRSLCERGREREREVIYVCMCC